MAMRNDEERQGLTNSFRSQTGYGTAPLTSATKKTTPKTRKFISKKVLRTDTLMGISLKYAVSVQELKKENKIWNSDHLFLREEILIPLTAENEGLLDEDDTIVVHDGFSSSPSPSFSHSDNSSIEPSLPNGGSSSFSAASNGNGVRGHSATFNSPTQNRPSSSASFADPLTSFPSSSAAASSKDLRASSFPSSSTESSSKSSSSSKRKGKDSNSNNNNNASAGATGSGSTIGAAESSVSGGSSSMAEDFFSKYDSSIARLRGDVEKMEKNAAKLDGLLDSNPLSLPPQALRRQSSGTSGYSRKGSAASLSSASGGERGGDRRSRAAALLLDEEEGHSGGNSSAGGSAMTSGSTVAVVHVQSESPVLMIRSRSNNKQVKSAIENLRAVDDDLFEL